MSWLTSALRSAAVPSIHAIAVVLALGVCRVSAAEEPQESDMVLVRRLVPKDFQASTGNSEKLNSVISDSLDRVVRVKPGDTLSGILKDEFRISESRTPSAYKSVSAHVQTRNGLNAPEDLKAGVMLRLPDLPQASQVPTNGKDLSKLQAKTSTATSWSEEFKGFITAPALNNVVSALAPKELQNRLTSFAELATKQLNPRATRDEQEASGAYQVLQRKVIAKLADGASQNGSSFLGPQDKAALAAFLARPPTTKPLLVVLDDGFPSQDDFRRAASFVIEASRRIRQAYSLRDAMHGDSSDLVALEKEMKGGTTFCDGSCEYPTLKSHAAMIRRSLEELTSLDTMGLVDVVYLPLNRAPRLARPMLAEMLRVQLLADSVTSNLVLKLGLKTVPPNLLPGTPDYAAVEDQVTRLLAPAYLGLMPSPATSGDLAVSTDKAVIDGVVNFLVLYSAASQRPHFLSMSWTTPANQLPAMLFRPRGYGLWLSAAGNDPALDVQRDNIQFASRSSDPGDVIAVANTDAAGCGTSQLSKDGFLPVMAVAFHGRFDATHCGTSFSTPRVAWLLAVREAVKGTPMTPINEAEWGGWRAKKHAWLLGQTKPTEAGELRYRIPIWSLLGEPTPQ